MAEGTDGDGATLATASSEGTVTDVQLHQLLDKLEEGEEQQCAALAVLARKQDWRRDQVTGLRLGGHVATLVALLEPSVRQDALTNALTVLLAAAEQDIGCKDALIKGGAVRRLCKLVTTASSSSSSGSGSAGQDVGAGGGAGGRGSATVVTRSVRLLCVRLLHQCINSGEIVREPAVEELFRLGAASKAVRFLEGSDAELAQATGGMFWEVTDIPAFRERCRDLGVIPTLLGLLQAHPDVPGYMGFINNISRSEALHLTLQEHGVIDVLDHVLERTRVEVNRTQALITVAHVYAGQEKHARSDELLSRYDASLSVMTMLEACLHGDSMFGGAWWALEEVVQAVQSLSQKPQHAERLVKVGCPDLLVEVLTARGDDDDAVFQACRAIANMASAPELKGRMQQRRDVVTAVRGHESSEDLRVQDAAKGALLQLGALKDQAVLAADSALSGDSRDYTQQYDVFLSHKRTDSKDFARALYNLLVVRGIRTFLDYEYREELSDLGQIVANSANLIFIMTDNIFDSPWCLKELDAAVEANINIVLLVKEGSRWKNDEGHKVCEFPGTNVLSKLSEGAQKVFTRKALYHSDEYYQTFVEMLVKKIIRQPAPPAADAPASAPTQQQQQAPQQQQQAGSGLTADAAGAPLQQQLMIAAGGLHMALNGQPLSRVSSAPLGLLDAGSFPTAGGGSGLHHLSRFSSSVLGGLPAEQQLQLQQQQQAAACLPMNHGMGNFAYGTGSQGAAGVPPAVTMAYQRASLSQLQLQPPLQYMTTPYEGTAEAGVALLQLQRELAAVRREALGAVQELRREHAGELHQLRLDLGQAVQQLRRELGTVGQELAAVAAAACRADDVHHRGSMVLQAPPPQPQPPCIQPGWLRQSQITSGAVLGSKSGYHSPMQLSDSYAQEQQQQVLEGRLGALAERMQWLAERVQDLDPVASPSSPHVRSGQRQQGGLACAVLCKRQAAGVAAAGAVDGSWGRGQRSGNEQLDCSGSSGDGSGAGGGGSGELPLIVNGGRGQRQGEAGQRRGWNVSGQRRAS